MRDTRLLHALIRHIGSSSMAPAEADRLRLVEAADVLERLFPKARVLIWGADEDPLVDLVMEYDHTLDRLSDALREVQGHTETILEHVKHRARGIDGRVVDADGTATIVIGVDDGHERNELPAVGDKVEVFRR